MNLKIDIEVIVNGLYAWGKVLFGLCIIVIGLFLIKHIL